MDEDESSTYDKYRDNTESDMIMDATSFLEKISCEVGANDCPFNAECIPLGLKLHNGICKCVPGTEENAQGACEKTIRPFSKGPTIPMDTLKKSDNSEIKNEDTKIDTTSSKTVQILMVSILSKEVNIYMSFKLL